MAEQPDNPAVDAQQQNHKHHKHQPYWSDVMDSFSFRGLHNSPREVWLMYALIVLDAFSYFATSFILVLYLSHDFGYSDIEAGWIYGLHGVSISLLAIFFGVTVDLIGVRATLFLGHALLVLGRIFLSYSYEREVILIALLVIVPLGGAFLTPTMSTGLRRFTNDKNRAEAFGLYVIMLNVGALIAAPTVDIIRSSYSMDEDKTSSGLNEYRVILSVCWIVSLFSVLVVFFVRDIDVDEHGKVTEYVGKGGAPTEVMKEIFLSKRFWRFMLFVTLLTGVRFVFRHLDATFPKFMIRTHGEDVPFATILAINPFLVIFLIPLATPAVHYMSLFHLILLGTIITALSVGFMVLGTEIWNAIAFIVVFSIGEAIWAPRLFEYSCLVAPKGREGTFMACASAPTFIAKLGVGGISGWLLTEYCPDTSTPANKQCDGYSLWLVVFLMTLSSPVLIFLLKPVIAAEGQELRDNNNDMSTDDEDNNSTNDAPNPQPAAESEAPLLGSARTAKKID